MSDIMSFQLYKLFESVECLSGEKLTEKGCKSELKENKGRARSRTRWLKKVCFARSLELRDVVTIYKSSPKGTAECQCFTE